jgi:integrase
MARRSGVEMEELSKHLGHAHASTTSDTYVHVDLAASRRRFRELVG